MKLAGRVLSELKAQPGHPSMIREEVQCIRFSDGLYFGDANGNRASGHGMMHFFDGHFYCGGFIDNRFNGFGFLCFPENGFLYGDFKNGKVEGRVFWINERMNFAKADLSDKSDGLNFVAANPEGISNVKVPSYSGKEPRHKVAKLIHRRQLGLLEADANMDRESQVQTRAQEGGPFESKGVLMNTKTAHQLRSTMRFSSKTKHTKKLNMHLSNPMMVMKYLKTMCLVSKEIYPEKDSRGTDLDEYMRTVKKIDSASVFKKEHRYVPDQIVTHPHFYGQQNFGGLFFPWGTAAFGRIRNDKLVRFGRAQYINGDYEWGFFQESDTALSQAILDSEHSSEVLRQRQAEQARFKEQKALALHGFGSRYYRQRGVVVTGFFHQDRLQGNYLVEFLRKGTFKFSFFHEDILKKDFFYCQRPFNVGKLHKELHLHYVNNTTKGFFASRQSVMKQFWDDELVKMQKLSSFRLKAQKAKPSKSVETKQDIGTYLYYICILDQSGRVLLNKQVYERTPRTLTILLFYIIKFANNSDHILSGPFPGTRSPSAEDEHWE